MDFNVKNIEDEMIGFFIFLSKKTKISSTANNHIEKACGIKDFFCEQKEYEDFISILNEKTFQIADFNKIEYGDFQTNYELALKTCSIIKSKNANPEILVEPTCGKGNFILAALNTFDSVKYIYAIDIYKPYIWEAKINILEYFLTNKNKVKPKINFLHHNIFDFDLKDIADRHKENEFLILGNPPWVTNSILSLYNSDNLPPKSNFKNHNGFDAITGKGNFDIGEYIAIMLFKSFNSMNGHFGMLLKNSVIKNIIYDQQFQKFSASSFERYQIDSKKEFSASVEASFLYCMFNSKTEYVCKEFSIYAPRKNTNKFGWYKNNFTSNIKLYKNSNYIDGVCPFEWRQGIKHDCSAIMELEKNGSIFINGNRETLKVEDNLVYGLLKSSDLNGKIINTTRKYTIVTQKKIGEDTSYIKTKYPVLYKYLSAHKDLFDKRKSSIYKGKPEFSIFGVGDYTFKRYKVAISGLYKSTKFSLIIPNGKKPYVLDDTCYFLGFDDKTDAFYTYLLLNSKITQKFLESIIFFDSKRAITKEILMRIDLNKLCEIVSLEYIKTETEKYSQFQNLSLNNWEIYLNKFQLKNKQLQIF
jgi:hypothetical protein